jgi:ABC-type multidrug transport system ATPase subunit
VSALDVSIQAQILELLARMRRERGTTLIFVSHNLAVVRQVCDRVAVMYLGKVVETGSARSVFEAPRHPYNAHVVSLGAAARPGARARTAGDAGGARRNTLGDRAAGGLRLPHTVVRRQWRAAPRRVQSRKRRETHIEWPASGGVNSGIEADFSPVPLRAPG